MTDYSLESQHVKRLDEDVLDFIHQGLENQEEERFNGLALREFELQYHFIEPYRQYCDTKGVSPASATHWAQIPAVPSMAFKKFILASFPVEKAEHAYFTSGTSNPALKGKIYRDAGAVRLIKEANGLLTRSFLFPDTERMKVLLMVPSPRIAPSMGMAVGLEEVRKRFGTPESRYLISLTGLNVKALVGALKESESSGEPIALIGATSGFVYFFKACQEKKVSFSLPEGSRVCDGGGYLGQFGECTKAEYFKMCENVLGVTAPFCVNVLGMGETSTNFFDNVLRNALVTGQAVPRGKEVPPWTRTMVVDTGEFKPVPKGEIGLLRHYDLVNRAMVFAVQTDNLGCETDEGFEIIGRWNKKTGAVGVDPSASGHPGGKIATQLTNLLMRRQLSGVGKVYSRLT
jgi:hypothetical protein